MSKVSRTFRIDSKLSKALDIIFKRQGDHTYNVEQALYGYKPIADLLNDKPTKAVAKPKAVIEIPDVINQQAWSEWVEYRKSKKKTVSKAAATKQFKMLSNYAFDIQQQIIDQSIQNDYQGLFELKGVANVQTQQSAMKNLTNTDWASGIELADDFIDGQSVVIDG
jgi:hypothetical protein